MSLEGRPNLPHKVYLPLNPCITRSGSSSRGALCSLSTTSAHVSSVGHLVVALHLHLLVAEYDHDSTKVVPYRLAILLACTV
jgi:hypothetical protein